MRHGPQRSCCHVAVVWQSLITQATFTRGSHIVDYGWHLTRTLRRFPLISIIIRTRNGCPFLHLIHPPAVAPDCQHRESIPRNLRSRTNAAARKRESTSCRHHCSVESVIYRRPHRPPSPHLPRPQLRQTGSFYFPLAISVRMVWRAANTALLFCSPSSEPNVALGRV